MLRKISFSVHYRSLQ